MSCSPDRKKIRSKTDLIVYLARNNLDLDPNQFDFSVRGKHNISVKKPTLSPKKKPSIKPIVQHESKNMGNGSVKISVKTGANGNSSTSPGNAAAGINSNKPKLIVKFSFPVARLKRSASMKSRKRKIARQKSQSSQSSGADPDSADISANEEGPSIPPMLGNNGIAASDASLDKGSAGTDIAYCDNLSESELFI